MKQFLPLIRDVLLILILVVGILLLDRNDKMVDEILERATKTSAQTAETTETADINTNTTPETAVADYNYIYTQMLTFDFLNLRGIILPPQFLHWELLHICREGILCECSLSFVLRNH